MKWLALRLGGQRWTVHIVSAKNPHLVKENGDRLLGSCVYEKNRIYLSRDLTDEQRNEYLLHECFHALLYVSGAEIVYGNNPKKDEHLVLMITPLWHRLLLDLGFRFPKGPYADDPRAA